MTVPNGQFKRVAEAVAGRTTELLRAAIFVTDDHGIVTASSEDGCVGLPFALLGHEPENCLRIPLHINGHNGEVIIAEPTNNGEMVPPRLVQGLVELVIKQAAVVDRLTNQHELKNTFIHDLLCGSIDDEATILREAQILGMDLTPPRAVILIDAADYILMSNGSGRYEVGEAQIQRRAQLVIASVVGFFKLPSDTICAYIGDGELAVLKASDTKNLFAWVDHEDEQVHSSQSWANLTALKRAGGALLARLRSDTRAGISVGIGRYHPGIRGLALSYQDARAALSLGRRLHGQNGVHCLDGLGIAAFVGVSDECTKIDLATYLLGPLDQEPELLETLDIFFVEDCCPSSTAHQLSIHRNTLGYRLDKITSLIGLDPRRFDDAVQIRLALLLRSLRRDPSQLCKCPIPERHEKRYVGQMPDAPVRQIA
ncbi:MAG: helix-turn-helix domain-containing protein [Ardenticatenaceae bacterium]|nr:helix-turn-helix domain-containing protein [Ardenticatenaceae bacterium]